MGIKIHFQDDKIKKKSLEVITEIIKNGFLVEKRRLLSEEKKKKSKPSLKRKRIKRAATVC